VISIVFAMFLISSTKNKKEALEKRKF
jgi:hypothetical protein